jgi:phosphatidylglycerol:prolipoprotein diacylglycerol transferase
MHASLIHLGHLHIPIFSAFAVVGLLVALFLSQKTAPLAGLSPEAMWDAGVVAAISVFVISRLLLVAFNFKSFLEYPVLILTLPSVTFTGLLGASLVMIVFLRYRGIPYAPLLDAAAPCLALLWAILSLGAFATGSTGLPTTLPWGIEDAMLGRIHPVEVYTAIAALALCIVLIWALVTAHERREAPGKTSATALFLFGAITFFLTFLTQPTEASQVLLLDPIQWLALAAIAGGAVMALAHVDHAPTTRQETSLDAI